MSFGVGRGRLSVAIVGIVVASLAWASPAEAKRKIVRKGGGYNPPTAAMVVDYKTNKVLFAENPDAHRHPASITKVMTLYMLFEQLEKGRYSLNSPLKVSAFASRQAPSKLGLQPGETIEVEDAIKALVTKSANDVAVVVAENIGGSEPQFAQMMTRKARSIGMWAAPFRIASRAIIVISRRTPSPTMARYTPITIICSAASRAWTASRPATPAPPASIC